MPMGDLSIARAGKKKTKNLGTQDEAGGGG